MNHFKESVPSYFAKERALRINRKPYKEGLTHDMVFGYKSPIARVKGIVSIVSYHKIVILLKCVLRYDFSLYGKLSFFNIHIFVSFIMHDYIPVSGQSFFIYRDCHSLLGNV